MEGCKSVENEKHLLIKAKNGDIEAFEKLIGEYQKKVFNIAFRMVGNHDDASEIAQEVFLKVYKSLKSFKEEASFSTWIYRITTNVCLDELRKKKNKKVISLDEEIKAQDGEMKRQVVDDSPTPEMAVEGKIIRKAVSDSIKMLSEEHRIVIVMRDIQGFSYEEIAKVLKCPEGTIKSRINRARQSLREILKNNKELFKEDCV
ncbi:MAG: sigma-70 family RNA polymerase sigma factor [Clostridia bacterium]|nr:sigma-70 family RNA polymerase sigma factor [Clostridia bacterium]